MAKWNSFWSQMITARICKVQYRGGLSHWENCLGALGEPSSLHHSIMSVSTGSVLAVGLGVEW